MVIETNRDLAEFCKKLEEAPALFIDTEFVGEGRYYPEVGAIQVAAVGNIALLDPIAITNFAPLQKLLLDAKIEKVFHSANQDLAILYRMIGRPVAPIFDTQIAAAILGYEGQISFGQLVERVTGTALKKSHSFTDWLQRPLSPKQIEYALEDVHYLAPVHESLTHELKARKRISWAREEFSKLENAARYVPDDPREVFRQIRGAEKLRGKELAFLQELAAWREETARETNSPTQRICMDGVLMELSRRPRKTLEELEEIRGLRPPQVKRFGAGLLEALRKGAQASPPAITRSPYVPAELEPTVDFLVLCLRSLAATNNISSGLLASRADLSAVALLGEKANVSLMRGWRKKAVGEALLKTLQGKAVARILPDTRQVHLEWNDN